MIYLHIYLYIYFIFYIYIYIYVQSDLTFRHSQAHSGTCVTFRSRQEGIGADFCRGRNMVEHSGKHTDHQQSRHLLSISEH